MHKGSNPDYFVLLILFMDRLATLHERAASVHALGSFLSMKELDWMCFSRVNSIVRTLFLVSLHQTVDLNYITT